jgi:hypothetical protein
VVAAAVVLLPRPSPMTHAQGPGGCTGRFGKNERTAAKIIITIYVYTVCGRNTYIVIDKERALKVFGDITTQRAATLAVKNKEAEVTRAARGE